MANVEMDINKIIEQLRKEGVTGVIYFVNPERGNNVFEGTTPDFPLATIAQANTLCSSYRHDAIVCFTNNNTRIALNAAGTGATINKAAVTVIGIHDIAIDNVNGGATSVLTIDAAHARVKGMRFDTSFAGTDIILTANADWSDVHDNIFVSPNIGVACAAVGCLLHHNNMLTHVGAVPSWINLTGQGNRVYSNVMKGSVIANSVGISVGAAAHGCFIYDNIIEAVQYGVVVNIAAANVVVSDNRWRTYLTDSQLTVANGVNAVTLFSHYADGASGVQFHVNCAFAAGPTGSFKANAAPGSQLTIWVEEWTIQDANWRRITPGDGRYKIRTTDDIDVLIAHDMHTVGMFRLRAQLDVAPAVNLDLDVNVVVNKEG